MRLVLLLSVLLYVLLYVYLGSLLLVAFAASMRVIHWHASQASTFLLLPPETTRHH
jgi:hypothetical protein